MKSYVQSIRTYLSSFPQLFSQPAILVWAVVLGIAGALTTISFHETVKFLQYLHSHQYGDPTKLAEQWSSLKKILVPTSAGVIAAIGLYWASKIKVDANSDYMEAVAIGNGRLSMRQGLLRVASALSVAGAGWSLGREGPIIHLAAMTGSFLGRFFRLDTNHHRLLVACGAAAGVSSAYFAPIAGALFVAEIVLGSMASHVLGPLMISSATAFITMRSLGFDSWLYSIPEITVIGDKYLIVTIAIGFLSGIFAPLFLKYLELCRQLFAKLGNTLFVSMTLGGFLLGCLIIIEPWVTGKGDTIIHSYLTAPWTLSAIATILLLKILSTGISVGCGAVGGVITPVMLMGASMAMLLTQMLALIFPDVTTFAPLFVLVGMGAFLGAATSAPLVAMVLVVEMSHSFNVIAPLMIATVTAFFISRIITGTVMFEVTEQREKNELVRNQLSKLKVKNFLNKNVNVLTPESTLQDVVNMFSEENVRYIYVVNAHNEFLGVIESKTMTRILLTNPDLNAPISPELIQRSYIEPLTTSMNLDQAQECFLASNGERLPVVDLQDPPHLVGIVYKSDVLRKLSEIKKIVDQSGPTVVDIRDKNDKS